MMRKKYIYFDNNSTTRVDKDVAKEVYRYMRQCYGNASCAHNLGMLSDVALQKAREIISDFLHVKSNEIYFSSGATESNNILIKGFLIPFLISGKVVHAITSEIEHPSVLQCFQELKKYFENLYISYIKVDKNGRVDIDEFREAVIPETVFASIMAANNETGNLQPIESISEICKRNSIVFHTDATQLFGKYPEEFITNNIKNIDMISLSGHKINAPKGVGAFYLKETIGELFTFMSGGGQEKGVRSGTENIPGIVGLGKAIALLKKQSPLYYESILSKKNLLNKEIVSICHSNDIDIIVNTNQLSLVNTLNFSIPESLNKELTSVEYFNNKGILLTGGSACAAKKPVESYVLRAMGRTSQESSSAIRISLGKYNTSKEINYFLEVFESYILSLKH